MKALALALPAALLAALLASDVHAQAPVRIRGTITAVDATALAVKTRDGRDVKLALPDNVTVSVPKAMRFEDIKAGDFVGATTTPGPDGSMVAVELHFLPPTASEVQAAWDLLPNSTMTNASVGGVAVVDGRREVTMRVKGQPQKIVVPDGTPIVRAVPGARSDLVVGEYVFAIAQVGADGVMTAPRVTVSKDGVRPPQ